MAAEGVVVHRLGVVPTPAVAFEANRRDALGAVISASHNPYHDNGIKLFAPRRQRSSPTRSRSGSSTTSWRSRRRPASRRSCSTPRRPPTTSSTSSSRPRGPLAWPGCASSSTAPTAQPASSRRRLFAAAGADVVAIHDHARRAQHQRPLRCDHLESLAGTVVVEHGRPRPRPRRRRRPVDGRRPRRPCRRRRPRHGDLRHRPARRRACCATTRSSSR